ncbi:hypothetical protein EXIGLDRAFT_40666 [Exidia glandulosa HHB12029]|uniref:Uncharacterized protein n=1 Tax=Exidia glandulosa HHB12029 TaxID=1314781 RepID=A0A165ILV6_EXIGL|nr:hypothetical protein EXIGLDRAFT_40666 [Exidia glandulosa HHB12029]
MLNSAFPVFEVDFIRVISAVPSCSSTVAAPTSRRARYAPARVVANTGRSCNDTWRLRATLWASNHPAYLSRCLRNRRCFRVRACSPLTVRVLQSRFRRRARRSQRRRPSQMKSMKLEATFVYI